jgi:hypothetical protein
MLLPRLHAPPPTSTAAPTADTFPQVEAPYTHLCAVGVSPVDHMSRVVRCQASKLGRAQRQTQLVIQEQPRAVGGGPMHLHHVPVGY